MKPSTILLVILFSVTPRFLFGQTESSLSKKQIQKLDSIAIQDVPNKAPGIATAVIKNGTLVYQKVAGYANLTDSTLITSKTRFNIASNGKQFTALAILLLEDEKKLKLSDDIRKYLPSILPQYPDLISIENLLNHSSGFRDVYDLWSLQGYTWWKKSFDNNDVLKLIEKQQELNFKPGTKYAYSNTNYILLAKIIEKISGQSFVEYTKDIFLKINMPSTSFEDNYQKIKEPIARAYFNFSTWQTYDWIWNVCGDGNLFSTLEDQIQWEKLLQKKNSKLLKKEIIDKSQKLTQNNSIQNYGYGLEFGSYKGIYYQFHEGATGAWKATSIRFPEHNLAIVTLTNTGKATPNSQTRQMADVILNLKENSNYFETKPSKVGSYISDDDILGIYSTENNFTFQFIKKENAIYLRRIGRNDVLLERESDNVFHQTYDADFKQEFTRDANGAIEITAYYTSHAPYTLKKITSDFTDFNFQSIEGKYSNSETKAIIGIKYNEDKNYTIRLGSQENLNGILLSKDKLLVESYVLQIISDTENAKTIVLHSDRIQNVKFERIN